MINTKVIEYIKSLEDVEHKIIGFYQHGSATLGYADQYSDIDILIVWENNYPAKESRQKTLDNHNIKINKISDTDVKGSDYLEIENMEYNLSHRPSSYFFKTYENAVKGTINEFDIYGLGGFQRGVILFDNNNKLQQYKDSLFITEELKSNFKLSRKNSTINNLHDLDIAIKRGQSIVAIKCLNYLLITFQIQLYLENNMFPVVPKWLEKDAEKFNWNNELLDTVKEINKSLAKLNIFTNLQNFSEKLNLTK